ncbi:MAG: ABC transporter substrate-binding protein [Deltaproteobacteria bacterium]|nr:ABC transporter substrate-binding protein [Deltaproteobacteria bacterium]
MKRFNSSLAFLFLALAAVGCKQKNQNVIRVGEFGSMTGTEATFGISTHRGIKMVIDDVNKAGGINGKQLELISYDEGGKPEEAVTVVTKLIAQDKVDIILGEVASSRSLAAAPIAQRNKVPMISPSSTNPKVTEGRDYVFRVCFTDPFQGKVLARFAREDLKAKRAALLIDKKSDYSVGLADFFRKTFESLGGEIVIEQNYAGGDMDFKGQLTSIKSKNVDVILHSGYYTEVALTMKQAKDLGIKTVFIGGDGWDSPKLSEIGGKAIDGHYFSNHYSVDDQDPRVQDFIKRYKALYKEVPDGLAAMGYDAALVMVDALKRTNGQVGPVFRDALAATKNFPGVTGVITIDENRNASKPAVILKVQGDGSYKFVKRVNP